MNCQQYQERILDAFAAGEATFPDALVEHKRNCGACRAYYESQASLFCSIDEGVKAIANEEVPRSLVPGVRALVQDELPSPSSWMSVWEVAAVAAAILAVSFGWVLYRPVRHTVSRNDRAPAHSVESPVAVMRRPAEDARPSPSRERKRTSARAFGHGADSAAAMPEVIVLPEERAAFARFVADTPEHGVVLAVTRAARSNEDVPFEIAVLEIHELEVQSLDPSWE
jgi:hypothetical protein